MTKKPWRRTRHWEPDTVYGVPVVPKQTLYFPDREIGREHVKAAVKETIAREDALMLAARPRRCPRCDAEMVYIGTFGIDGTRAYLCPTRHQRLFISRDEQVIEWAPPTPPAPLPDDADRS